MSIFQIDWYSFEGWGGGYHTLEVNIAPAWVGAQASLYRSSGPGTSNTGIKHYRRNYHIGPSVEHDFGEWTTWPPAIFDHINSVTFAVMTGTSNDACSLARIDYWNYS